MNYYNYLFEDYSDIDKLREMVRKNYAINKNLLTKLLHHIAKILQSIASAIDPAAFYGAEGFLFEDAYTDDFEQTYRQYRNFIKEMNAFYPEAKAHPSLFKKFVLQIKDLGSMFIKNLSIIVKKILSKSAKIRKFMSGVVKYLKNATAIIFSKIFKFVGKHYEVFERIILSIEAILIIGALFRIKKNHESLTEGVISDYFKSKIKILVNKSKNLINKFFNVETFAAFAKKYGPVLIVMQLIISTCGLILAIKHMFFR